MGSASSTENQPVEQQKTEKTNNAKESNTDQQTKRHQPASPKQGTRLALAPKQRHVQFQSPTPKDVKRIHIPDEFSDTRPLFVYQNNFATKHNFFRLNGRKLEKLKANDRLPFINYTGSHNATTLSKDKTTNGKKETEDKTGVKDQGHGDEDGDVEQDKQETTDDKNDITDDKEEEEGKEVIYTIDEILKRAAKPDQSTYNSHSKFLAYITEDVDQYPNMEQFTAWVILVWMANRNVRRPMKTGGTLDTPKGCIVLLSQDTKNYSKVFARLCSEANLRCECIQGIAKSSNYVPGSMETGEMVAHWNSIQLKSKWHLLNPLWICRPELGPTGQVVEGKSIGVMEEYFYLTNPKEFIYWCHPDHDKWQLLSNAISRNTFLTLPLVRPDFFRYNLSLVSRRECVLESEDGSVQIKIECPNNVSRLLYFWYSISVIQAAPDGNVDTDAEQELSKDQKESLRKLPYFVVMSNFLNTWTFDITFPIEGIYEIDIKAGEDKNTFKSVALFRLFCLKRKAILTPLPFNPEHIGFGPGTETKKFGLLYPSHRHGIYRFNTGDKVDISFRINKNIIDSTSFECVLIGKPQKKDISESESTTKEVKHKVNNSKGELEIQVNLAQRGLYVLTINATSSTVGGNSKSSKSNVQNVCNYLFTSDITEKRKGERADQLKAREMLRIAMKRETLDSIDLAVANCLRVDIPLSDDQVAAAHTKAHILSAKRDIDAALKERTFDVVSRTLSNLQQDGLDDILHEDIQKLKVLKQKIELQKSSTTED